MENKHIERWYWLYALAFAAIGLGAALRVVL